MKIAVYSKKDFFWQKPINLQKLALSCGRYQKESGYKGYQLILLKNLYFVNL